MNTIDESDLITWVHTKPSRDDLKKVSDLSDDLSETAFDEDIKTSREKALLIVALLWPPTY
jgi:hypothetical protein